MIAGERLVAGVIKDARRRHRRRRLSAALVICAGVGLGAVTSGRGPQLSGPPAGTGWASAPSSGGRVVQSAGVSVKLPSGWVAKTAVLPQGGGSGLAWIQATNFASGSRVRGEDPLKAMSAREIAVTITERTSRPTHVGSQDGALLSVSHARPQPPGQAPPAHLVLELTPTVRGRALVIDIDFGSTAAKAPMAAEVNRVLQTLNVGPGPSGTGP